MTAPLVISGSAHADGATLEAVRAVFANREVPVVDLAQCRLSPYDYQHRNRDDDFAGILDRLFQADPLIFATPVYWFSMSAWMKIFFDRFSDLLDLYRERLPELSGKRCYLVVAGTQQQLPEGFGAPFRLTCEYLGMTWGGAFYYCSFFPAQEPRGRARDAAARQFGERITSAAPR